MREQALDLRRFVQIVRRRMALVCIVAALGLLAGGAFSALNPPTVTSKALVAFPQPLSNMPTEVVIAGSDPVLSGALPHISPPVSLAALRSDVHVRSLTSSILAISAQVRSAAQAEAIANAVASSYVAYIVSPASPVGHVPAKVFVRATSATGSTLINKILIGGIIGALVGAFIGVILSLVIGRKDRRLWRRDDIANAIGIPVLASVPVQHPVDAADWMRLLESYQPAALHAWHLRNALRQLGMLGVNLDGGDDSPFSVTVLSLSSDTGALALGPQLAVFAASLGISTALVIGPQQDPDVTATLRTACAAPPGSSKRSSRLRVAISDGGGYVHHYSDDVTLTVVVAVVDSRTPRMPDTLSTTATVLGVSAGAASGEQLAGAAMSAAADGREIVGILVADPEPTDHTTGRTPQLGRPAQRRLPVRLKSITTEIRR